MKRSMCLISMWFFTFLILVGLGTFLMVHYALKDDDGAMWGCMTGIVVLSIMELNDIQQIFLENERQKENK